MSSGKPPRDSTPDNSHATPTLFETTTVEEILSSPSNDPLERP